MRAAALARTGIRRVGKVEDVAALALFLCWRSSASHPGHRDLGRWRRDRWGSTRSNQHTGDQIKVNGDVVVAVPAKDVILATGSRDCKNLKAMRQLASDLAKGSYGLLDTLFVYRKGRFVKFGRD